MGNPGLWSHTKTYCAGQASQLASLSLGFLLRINGASDTFLVCERGLGSEVLCTVPAVTLHVCSATLPFP